MSNFPNPDARAAATCGAKTRAGTPCRSHPMANGRCRMHGGASTGPRDPSKLRGNRNAVKFGTYSRRVLPGERELISDLLKGVDSLDAEIVTARLLLRRMYAAHFDWEKRRKELDEKILPALQRSLLESGAGDEAVALAAECPLSELALSIGSKVVWRAHGYLDEIMRLLGRIMRLELARAKKNNPFFGKKLSPKELLTARFRQALQNISAATGGADMPEALRAERARSSDTPT